MQEYKTRFQRIPDHNSIVQVANSILANKIHSSDGEHLSRDM